MSMENSTRITGHIGQINKINETEGEEFVSVTCCVNMFRGYDDSDQPITKPVWFDVVAFKGGAKGVVNSGMEQGDEVSFFGYMDRRESAKDGVSYINWNLVMDEFDIVSRKSERPAKEGEEGGEQKAAAKPAAKKAAAKPAAKAEPAKGEDDFDDDIPF